MKRRIFLWIALLLLVSAAIFMPRMVESSIPTVYYITPNQKSYRQFVNCSGVVQSEFVRELYLSSPIVAEEVLVEVGDQVYKNQVLFYIDQEKTTALSAASGILQSISSVPSAGIDLKSIDWASLAATYGLSAVAGTGLDYGGEIAAFLSQSGLQQGGKLPSPMLMDDLDEITEVLAQAGGIVTDVSIRPGVPAYAGQALITISDNKSYKVVASVAEGDIARISSGDKATIHGVGFAGSSYTGTVTKIYPTARRSLGSSSAEAYVDVEISIESADAKLKPGFTAKVQIEAGNSYEMITVPYEAIKQDSNNDEFVYLYSDGKIKKQIVTTGQELTNEVEILSGMDYDSIVLFGVGEEVREGEMINIRGRADVD